LCDIDPAKADRLRSLCGALRNPEGISPVVMLDLFDEHTIHELGRALTGRMTVEERALSQLVAHLSGRRLTRRKVVQVVDEWIDRAGEDTVLSIVGDSSHHRTPPNPSVSWWPLLRPDLFREGHPETSFGAQELRAIEAELEKLFPAAVLHQQLKRLDGQRLSRFIIEEPCHTRAVQTAWILLAERILRHDIESLAMEAHSSHLIPEEAVRIRGRVGALRGICDLFHASFPDRLRVRLPIAGILFDPWSTGELQSLAETAIGAVATSGKDWLDTLPRAGPLAMRERTVVIVIEAVAPDVWLETMESFSPPFPFRSAWCRLDVEPATIPAMNAMFGFGHDRDPSDEFAARGISYHDLEGNEPHPAVELVPGLDDDTPQVIRLSLLDHAAHGDGARSLIDMPAMLRNVMERHLLPILEYCSRLGRHLMLTTDHGLTLSRRMLAHGSGGVYEQAVFRAEWSFGGEIHDPSGGAEELTAKGRKKR
jgi:hypothetical protein